MSEMPLPSLPKGPIQNQTLIALLTQSFERMGTKPAVTFLRNGIVETSLSFAQLHRDSDILAQSFVEMGVVKGDRVIVFLPKCVYWLVAHIALLKIGAICVPLNPDFKAEEIDYFSTATSPRIAIVGVEQERIVKQVNPNVKTVCANTAKPYESVAPSGNEPPPVGPYNIETKDPALIVFTSGTTGRPKGAVLTHGNLSHDTQNIIGIWEVASDDVFCHALPLFHVHGLCFGAHTSLLAGATMIMPDSFDSNVVLDILSQKETTMFMGVPAMYSKLIEHNSRPAKDYSHLRLLTSGSAPLPEKTFDRIRETFGKEPVEREGMSETLMNFSNPIRGKRRPGSIGFPLPYLEAKIVDPATFEDVPEGQIGEIWLKSPAITSGYWQNSEETERAFHDGWFRTGDLGRRDEDGYYFLTDRIKNIIISGGENVSPKEVEIAINRHNDVLESCVVGVQDEKWGELVVAAIVARSGATISAGQIKNHCKERLMNWKCPKKVIIVYELPRNRMGKVMGEDVKKLFIE